MGAPYCMLGSSGGMEPLTMVPVVRFGCRCGVPIGIDNNGNAVPVFGAHVDSPSKYGFWRHLSYWSNWAYESVFTASTRWHFLFSRRKNAEFDYNEYDIVLNHHRRFPQKGDIWCTSRFAASALQIMRGVAHTTLQTVVLGTSPLIIYVKRLAKKRDIY